MLANQKNKILDYLQTRYPNAGCELLYRKDYELLIAVVLSAQTTDAAVNLVTPKLFQSFPTLVALAKAPLKAIEKTIQSIGLYRHKAKHIQGLATILIQKHHGKVPSDKQALTMLPGVGIKTANVVRAELFGIPEIAVDTHVHRLAWRLGFTNGQDDVTQTEKKLRKALREDQYIAAHHQLIHFGRDLCQARKPKCYACGLVAVCREPNKQLKE